MVNCLWVSRSKHDWISRAVTYVKIRPKKNPKTAQYKYQQGKLNSGFPISPSGKDIAVGLHFVSTYTRKLKEGAGWGRGLEVKRTCKMSLVWPICAMFCAEIPLPPRHAKGTCVSGSSGGWNGATESKLSFIFCFLQDNLFDIDSWWVSPIL